MEFSLRIIVFAVLAFAIVVIVLLVFSDLTQGSAGAVKTFFSWLSNFAKLKK